MDDDSCGSAHVDADTTCPWCATAFDAAITELLRCFRIRDDLRRRGDASLEEVIAAWLALDRARAWVSTFEGAGRQVGLGTGLARPTPGRSVGR